MAAAAAAARAIRATRPPRRTRALFTPTPAVAPAALPVSARDASSQGRSITTSNRWPAELRHEPDRRALNRSKSVLLAKQSNYSPLHGTAFLGSTVVARSLTCSVCVRLRMDQLPPLRNHYRERAVITGAPLKIILTLFCSPSHPICLRRTQSSWPYLGPTSARGWQRHGHMVVHLGISPAADVVEPREKQSTVPVPSFAALQARHPNIMMAETVRSMPMPC